IFGLETIKEQYLHDADFKDVLLNCKDGRTWNKFVLNDGFVFREAHGGGLMGHFGVKKTEDVLASHFFWPHLKPYFGEEDELASRTTSIQEGGMMRTSHLLIQPLYLQPHKYKDQSLELVPNNLTIRNDGPSMDEEDKHWSMITHGGGGSKHVGIKTLAGRLIVLRKINEVVQSPSTCWLPGAWLGAGGAVAPLVPPSPGLLVPVMMMELVGVTSTSSLGLQPREHFPPCRSFCSQAYGK
ncbi:hypothetical protein QYE76_042795, partial [Lolium multiflorum]